VRVAAENLQCISVRSLLKVLVVYFQYLRHYTTRVYFYTTGLHGDGQSSETAVTRTIVTVIPRVGGEKQQYYTVGTGTETTVLPWLWGQQEDRQTAKIEAFTLTLL